MQLEDYFDFLAPNDIRIKGHRIGIETILYDYIHRSQTPEQIADSYRTISLEQVYATITYYLYNKSAVDKYLTDWIEYGERARAEQEANLPPGMLRLRRFFADGGDLKSLFKRVRELGGTKAFLHKYPPPPDSPPHPRQQTVRSVMANFETLKKFLEATEARAAEKRGMAGTKVS